jgi:hypothetical protein
MSAFDGSGSNVGNDAVSGSIDVVCGIVDEVGGVFKGIPLTEVMR